MKYLVFMSLFSSCLLAQNVKSHKWEERVFIISGNEATRDTVEIQFQFFEKESNKMKERKLVIYKCIEKACVYYDFKAEPKMFNRTETSNEFTIRLFGLDGGNKFSSTKIIDSNVIFNLVDSMPMRRQELRNKQ